MAKNSALPIIIGAGALLLLMSGGKKGGGGSSGPTPTPGPTPGIEGNFGDFGNATAIDMAAVQVEINKYPRQLWVIAPPRSDLGVVRELLQAAARLRPDMGFALVNCELFIPYEGQDACARRAGTWELRNPSGVTYREGVIGQGQDFETVLEGIIEKPIGDLPSDKAPFDNRSALFEDIQFFGELWDDEDGLPAGYSIAVIAQPGWKDEVITEINQFAIENPDMLVWLLDVHDFDQAFPASAGEGDRIIAKDHATGQTNAFKLKASHLINQRAMENAIVQAANSLG